MEQIQSLSTESQLPFSEAIKHGETIYVSGQGPVDPHSREIVGTTPEEQVDRTLDNIARILQAGGSSLESIVKATVYLNDIDHYDRVNDAYGTRLTEPYPARTAMEVVNLPVDIMVEIDVIAAVED
ncbi:RidA family protein [Halorarum salinum]|uniref:RidA family protein n=1 Tax=Halorarum salinum TaxID=2743089 RepID=A0A7D5Q8J9_9EURY|nr:RidA family protein [Halobaculum salinum]QLG61056.1 RidA family protein [Halobaculum salinum]